MTTLRIVGARLVNEGRVWEADLWVQNGRIAALGSSGPPETDVHHAEGLLLLPGVIDDQVHFREPGLTHKGSLATESRAAVAGGTTSFMDMPNVKPSSTTLKLLEERFALAARYSPANYSFYLGVTNTNLADCRAAEAADICGLKAFLGSSTGDLLVDDPEALERLFAETHLLVAVHAEHEPGIRQRTRQFVERFGEGGLRPEHHPLIRDHEVCWRSSSAAVELARRHGTRLHVLHISTARELELFDAHLPRSQKRITAEACLHHLWFTDADYATYGNFIKWNPAVKTAADREALWQAVNDGRIDVLATDHAPHTLAEKQQPYLQCPSGGPLVQHSLVAWLECVAQGRMRLETAVDKLSHAPAELFGVVDRGFLREGYWADLVLVDPNAPWTVTRDGLRYACGWSPFEGQSFRHRVHSTYVNGQRVYHDGQLTGAQPGMRLQFRPPWLH